MPIYEFTCQECGLRFERLFRQVSDQPTHACDCGGEGTRQVSAVSFKFNHPASQRNGVAPPNTGTSDDWNFDKAIGHDAEQKWGEIHKNRSRKAGIIRDEAKEGRGITMDHLVKKREGGYRVMEEGERKYVNQHRKAAFDIANASKTHSKDKKPDK